MGTNYYAVTPPCAAACEHCGKSERIHICKSMTSFRGYARTEWVEPEELPLGREIRSWSDWKNVLRSPAAVIEVEDEYGVRQAVEDFIAEVEKVEPTMRSRQYDWMRRNRPQETAAGTAWRDRDGFSFDSREFC